MPWEVRLMRPSRFTPEQKREIVLALLGGRVPVAELCREHQVSSTTLYNWRDDFLEGGLKGLRGDGASVREAEQDREIQKLKQLVGDLSLANYALKGGAGASTGNHRGGR